jgi:ATP/ADP translocase
MNSKLKDLGLFFVSPMLFTAKKTNDYLNYRDFVKNEFEPQLPKSNVLYIMLSIIAAIIITITICIVLNNVIDKKVEMNGQIYRESELKKMGLVKVNGVWCDPDEVRRYR